MISFTVEGHPATKGSVRAVVRGRTKAGKAKAITIPMSKRLPAWNEAVGRAAREAMRGRPMYDRNTPVEVVIHFYMPRPKKPSRSWPRCDVDKLLRATLDAMSGIVFADDDQVVDAHPHKWFAGMGSDPGATIHVKEHRWAPGEDVRAPGRCPIAEHDPSCDGSGLSCDPEELRRAGIRWTWRVPDAGGRAKGGG